MADTIYNNTLSGLIEAAKKFESGEWNEDVMAEYGQGMKVRAYLPILEKTSVIISIMNNHLLDTGMAEFAIADMHKDLFFYGLLQGYGLVDCSNKTLVTFENYDLLFPLFYPFLVSYCKDDFELFKEMFKDTINLTNMRTTLDALAEIDVDKLDKNTAANASILNTFKSNKDIIEQLNNIAVMNDPTTAKVVEELKRMALEEDIKDDATEEK